ncbi:DUF3325 family protein [Pseudomonas cannabina]|uniref:Iron uptake protein n=1 Tax=Pseudomonas cannabina TaxID=86840 RepID=A0AB37Q3J7_PSECA|nr:MULTISPECIES: DUF3325 family protein [Pseudomonas syringae group]KPB70351.1 Uncharacterized protein AC507_3524 [Pseudomonas syringae pv. maculicola]KPW26271.1 hypothetical protein ALO83_104190 [Pseudomonas cannabina pv. alisalensis]RMN76446.1 hypothetical protein ALQ53_103906 [Pseudomonas cannabina]UBY96789.1 DUF3325 family protein [Pseudomonas cannabina pv. alisalensis]
MDATPSSRCVPEKRAPKTASKGRAIAYRLAVTSRALAAIFAGYLLASLVSVCIAQWLPVPRAEAALDAYGWIMGPVHWFAVLMSSALLLVALLAFRPRWVLMLAGCGVLLSPLAALSQSLA